MDPHELAALGVFVHGMLTGLHLLGVVYNVRRRNWWDAAIHTGVAMYDLWAVQRHIEDLRPEQVNHAISEHRVG